MVLTKGSISALLGRNGAGKSTLLRSIAGLIAIGAGTVRIEAERVDQLSTQERIRKGIAFVAQHRECFPDLTVRENLDVAMSCLGLTKTERAKRRAEVVSLLPLLQPLARSAGQLSGGQQQILVFAMALCQQPKLLLLDEPSTGLSYASESAILTALRSFSERDGTVLLVEQKPQFCAAIADRVLFLDNGIIEAQGAPKEVLDSRAFVTRYLQFPTGVQS
jgi:branched-chain amino acid transport system ATP-binding protein